MKKQILLIVILLNTSLNYLQAGIIIVAQDGSADVVTVQDGINTAQPNDTVLVMPGIYYENLVIENKPLTLTSNYLFSSDPIDISNAVLDGKNENTVINIYQMEEQFTLQGVTIQHGYCNDFTGGGINIEDNGIVNIFDCIIEYNTADSGGGIRVDNTEVYFMGTTIRYNHAYFDGGGLILLNGIIHFSEESRCNIYMNHAVNGSDILKTYLVEPFTLYADTLTVENPSIFYILSRDNLGNPLNDLVIEQLHAQIEEVGSDVFVSPDGDNANDGLTPDSPFKNIWYAMMKIKSNPENPHTVNLLPGTYSPSTNQEMFPVHCKPNSKIIGESMQSVLLNAEQTTGIMDAGKGHQFAHIENMELKNGSGAENFGGGIFIRGLDSLVIKNIHLHHLFDTDYGLYVSSTKNSFLKNIEVNDVITDGRAVSVGNSEANTLNKSYIENLYVHDNTPGSGSAGGGGMKILGVEPYINSMEVTMVNSLFTNNYNNETYWSNMGSALYISSHVDLRIYNSIFTDNTAYDGGAVEVSGVYGGANVNIYNSIIYGNSPEELSIDDEPSTLNLYHCNIHEGLDGIDIVGDHTVTLDSGCIDIDPCFTAYNGSDYFLANNSPCINTGTMDLGNNFQWPATDLMGNPRLHGNVDIGAYENPFVPLHTIETVISNTSVFPNPGNDFIEVDTELNEFTFSLYNAKANNVIESQNQKNINTSFLKSGIYFYRILKDGEVYGSGKWVKR